MSEELSQGCCKVQKGDSKTKLSKHKANKSGSTDIKPEPTTKRMDIPDCAVCLQSCVHPVELPCSHVFCFLCMKGASTQYRRCALCRQEIPVDFFLSPKLLHQDEEEEEHDDEEKEEEVEESYTWFYEGRNGWWQYDVRTDVELEESYRANKRTFELLIAGYVYVIDLDSMLQYRRSDPSRRRRIKRDLVSAAKKGIAGLKINVKREEDSGDRRVVGAEEDKENGGAVGGATATPEDSGTDIEKDEDDSTHDGTIPCEKEGVESDASIEGIRSTSPNANHSNSAGNETVYEVVRSAPPHRTREELSPPDFSYTNPSPVDNPPPTYAKPIRQRRKPANASSSSGPSSQTVDDTQGGSPPAQQLHVTINHQRTHSAPESRPSTRPRGPAPQVPPRGDSSQQSSSSATQRTEAEDNPGDVERVTETLRSELVINVGSNADTSSGARRRRVRRQVHEV